MGAYNQGAGNTGAYNQGEGNAGLGNQGQVRAPASPPSVLALAAVLFTGAALPLLLLLLLLARARPPGVLEAWCGAQGA